MCPFVCLLVLWWYSVGRSHTLHTLQLQWLPGSVDNFSLRWSWVKKSERSRAMYKQWFEGGWDGLQELPIIPHLVLHWIPGRTFQKPQKIPFSHIYLLYCLRPVFLTERILLSKSCQNPSLPHLSRVHTDIPLQWWARFYQEKKKHSMLAGVTTRLVIHNSEERFKVRLKSHATHRIT